MGSTLPLLLLPGQLRYGMVISVRVNSMGQIEIFNPFLYFKAFNYVQTNNEN